MSRRLVEMESVVPVQRMITAPRRVSDQADNERRPMTFHICPVEPIPAISAILKAVVVVADDGVESEWASGRTEQLPTASDLSPETRQGKASKGIIRTR